MHFVIVFAFVMLLCNSLHFQSTQAQAPIKHNRQKKTRTKSFLKKNNNHHQQHHQQNLNVTVLVHIAIVCAWSDHNTRQHIRHSWLTFPGNFSYSFIIGKSAKEDNEIIVQKLKLKSEIETYDDIIIGDFIDSYYNLTRKAVVMLSLHKQAEYIFKADTDTYVNVPHLLRYIHRKKNTGTPTQYAGRIVKNLLPDRDIKARWHMPHTAWPDDKKPYPAFAQGQGYLIKSTLAVCMLQIIHQEWSDSRLNNFPLEDVFIGMLAESCDEYPKHLVSFAQYVKQKKEITTQQQQQQQQQQQHLKLAHHDISGSSGGGGSSGSDEGEGVTRIYNYKEWIYAHRKTGSEILVHLLAN